VTFGIRGGQLPALIRLAPGLIRIRVGSIEPAPRPMSG
jgi:hypothetical protein